MGLSELDLTIGHIIKMHPETRTVFVNNGFSIFGDDCMVEDLGSILKLKTALKSKGLNAQVFVQLLRDKIAETGRYRLLEPHDGSGRLNLLTLLPCPLKIPLQSELNFILHQLQQQGLPLNYSIDISANKYMNYADYIKYFEDPDEVPDVILTTGYDVFHRNFIERFVRTGVFAHLPGRAVNPQLEQAGIVDPDGFFTVIAVNTLVMVVDKNRLGDLPVPRVWEDLLKPVYKKKVVMRGHGDIFCDVLQLNFYKDYGDAGLTALAGAIKYGLHPAQMVKELLSSHPDVPPIHIMPRFFAETLRNRNQIEMIWPEDGAMAYPISLLVKAEKMSEMKQLVDYLTGEDFARICDQAFFPAVYLKESGLPSTAKFKWTGWEYIKTSNIEVLIDELNAKFILAQQAGGN
ncbi:ABC transporter substrate-binding protein [bacterium BFN5]|nr:ABC transporter substrate-binding protein [bacterium BFN5]